MIDMMELSSCRSFLLVFGISSAFLFWGLMMSLQPPFYPSEAEKKGATPIEVRCTYYLI